MATNKPASGIKVFRENESLKTVIISALLILAISLLASKKTPDSSCNSRFANDDTRVTAGEIRVKSGTSRKIYFPKDYYWSEGIVTEPYKHFEITPSKEYEICFWANNRCSKVTAVHGGNSKIEFGKVPMDSFRLRSKENGGYVTVTVE